MDSYRGIQYKINLVDGVLNYTIYLPGKQIIRGDGNHGAVKTIIDRFWAVVYRA